MAKRPSIIDQMELTQLEPPQEVPQESRAATPLTNRNVHKTSIYLPREAFDRLREIAFTKRCKVHDLIMQGVDRVIAEHGHGEKASRS
jgi:predicted DNA-binding ribbon-helix-helix protein